MANEDIQPVELSAKYQIHFKILEIKREKEKVNQCNGLLYKPGSDIVHTVSSSWYKIQLQYILSLAPFLKRILLRAQRTGRLWAKDPLQPVLFGRNKGKVVEDVVLTLL